MIGFVLHALFSSFSVYVVCKMNEKKERF